MSKQSPKPKKTTVLKKSVTKPKPKTKPSPDLNRATAPRNWNPNRQDHCVDATNSVNIRFPFPAILQCSTPYNQYVTPAMKSYILDSALAGLSAGLALIEWWQHFRIEPRNRPVFAHICKSDPEFQHTYRQALLSLSLQHESELLTGEVFKHTRYFIDKLGNKMIDPSSVKLIQSRIDLSKYLTRALIPDTYAITEHLDTKTTIRSAVILPSKSDTCYSEDDSDE